MPDRAAASPHDSRARGGLLSGLAAYLWWGLAPFYFKAVAHVPAMEVLAHRVAWSVVLLGGLLTATRQWGAAREALRDGRTRARLLVTALLVGFNWLVFIWAVGSGHLVEASLGYFINPLVNVALGTLVLAERLRRPQMAAVGLATAGVLTLTLSLGKPPWISLALALSFSLYGLLRKTARVESLVGLSLETLLLFPLAIGYLLALRGGAFGAVSPWTDFLLLMAGVVTAVPLLWFTVAARRLRYTTVGLIQYLAPTVQLAIAVLAFGEAFSRAHAVAFGCIWAGLLLYTADTLRELRGPKVA